MEVISQSWRSDLALLALEGVEVEHHSTYVVCSHGLLLLRRAPLRQDVRRVLDLVESSFPASGRAVVAIDDPDAVASDLAGLAAAGYTISRAVALTVALEQLPSLSAPGPEAPTSQVVVRPLSSTDDWAARTRLLAAGRPVGSGASDRVAAERQLEAAGLAAWWGGFDGPRLMGTAGVALALPQLVRCQGVDLVPAARGTGLASRLVSASLRAAAASHGATTAMMVAEHRHAALALYEQLGFRPREAQVSATRG